MKEGRDFTEEVSGDVFSKDEYEITKSLVYENTFLPRCRSKKLSIGALSFLVRKGFCCLDALPPNIRKFVISVLNY